MKYSIKIVSEAAENLKAKLSALPSKAEILKDPELKSLFAKISKLPPSERAVFGGEVNQLRDELKTLVANHLKESEQIDPVDITAPFGINSLPSKRPHLLDAAAGSQHPLMQELDKILDIFYRMGFSVVESRQLDDDYHMFETLNFPSGHPARDDYDTFITTDGLLAPAHTSTMQNRVLKQFSPSLKEGEPIAVVIPGRVFRNEDLDVRHEHTFYQLEGVYVSKDINAGNLIATLKSFLEAYYSQVLEVKIQPFYFPFTEPSFEFAMSCPFCKKMGCPICGQSGWIELLGCGLIHPNVLKMAGIDSSVYSGFAWGGGIDRLVMMKYNIEDIRYFESARLDFLRQFS